MHRTALRLTSFFALFSLLAVPGCGSDDGEGDAAGACSIVNRGDGTSVIQCPDGSELVVNNGTDGKDGVDGKDGEKGDKGDKGDDAACTLDEVDGKYTLTCDGESVVIGDSCDDGYPFDVVLDDGEVETLLVLLQVSNCTRLSRDVFIDGYPEVELPKVLSRIEKIDGDIYIQNNTKLKEVSFAGLITVGSDIRVRDNDALEKLDFPALTTIGDGLWFERNTALIDIDGFPALESLGSWLGISEHPALESVSNFVALKSVRAIDIVDNDSLESIAEFPVLEEITGPATGYPVFSIQRNPVLTSIGKLGEVSEIDGDVQISGNSELAKSVVDDLLDGIDITGDVKVCGNKDGDSC